jgi:hypothetical protein
MSRSKFSGRSRSRGARKTRHRPCRRIRQVMPYISAATAVASAVAELVQAIRGTSVKPAGPRLVAGPYLRFQAVTQPRTAVTLYSSNIELGGLSWGYAAW